MSFLLYGLCKETKCTILYNTQCFEHWHKNTWIWISQTVLCHEVGRNMDMTLGHDAGQIQTHIPYINRSLSEWHQFQLCSLSLQSTTVILYLNKTRLLLSIINSLVKNKWLKLESRKPANVLFIYLQINCYWQYLSSE